MEIRTIQLPDIYFFGARLSPAIEYVILPDGSFVMGSLDAVVSSDEYPRHEVNIKSFGMNVFPITNAQWAAIASLPKVEIDLFRSPAATVLEDADYPAVNVSWNDCQEAIARLNAYFPELEFSLPSEAQWEYACRAGTTTAYWYGEDPDLEKMNCFQGDLEDAGLTLKGAYPPNPWGLYDMHGNVWEWCQDDWHDTYKGAPTDGSAWMKKKRNNSNISATEVDRGILTSLTVVPVIEGGFQRKPIISSSVFAWRLREKIMEVKVVLRGGACNMRNYYCRSANREWEIDKFSSKCIGFRVVIKEKKYGI